jgi:hypothetical protein
MIKSEIPSNNDLLAVTQIASTESGAGVDLRHDQRKRVLAGRAAEIKRVITRFIQWGEARAAGRRNS